MFSQQNNIKEPFYMLIKCYFINYSAFWINCKMLIHYLIIWRIGISIMKIWCSILVFGLKAPPKWQLVSDLIFFYGLEVRYQVVRTSKLTYISCWHFAWSVVLVFSWDLFYFFPFIFLAVLYSATLHWSADSTARTIQ